MSTEQHSEVEHPHRKHKNVAQRMEHLVGIVMVIAVAILAIWLVYGIVNTGGQPSWMK
jgi:heme/copper-type cytochrome/quinol oxidase subunit 4